MIDAHAFAAVFPHADVAWLDPLNAAMNEYSINDTASRAQMFVAQVAAESGLVNLTENMDYSAGRIAEVWPSHFNDQNAPLFAHNPRKLANAVYSNRMGNGAPESGDGWVYVGRGPLMLTGRSNYGQAGYSLNLELLKDPMSVADDMTVGARCAAWDWATTGCNQLADDGDFEAVTRKINGGLIGLAQRQAWLRIAQQVIS